MTAETDVVIVGLGPTGLVLAHMLGMRGRRVTVLEREPVFYGNARAVYTDDECMRTFQHIGVAGLLQQDMLQETPVQFVRADGSVIGRYIPLERPYGWPVVNFYYQPYLESTLAEALRRYPSVEVRRGRELVDFASDADGVTVRHGATGASDAAVESLRASYLIGADGGRSTVRKQLGVAMSGKNFPEPWLVVDLKANDAADGLRHLPYFNFVCDPELPAVSCVQPDGHHRFEFMLTGDQTKESMERPETVRELLAKFVDPDKFAIKRKLVYTFNALVADEWRRGRVFLAGDAAHMTPQFMGQGASSGIRDAYNLGWKLDAVLAGHAGDALLDTYERERRDHAKAMIETSVMLKNVVSMSNPLVTAARDIGLAAARAVPPARKWLETGGFKPSPVYRAGRYFGLPRGKRGGPEGALAPQPEVRSIDGRRVLLDDVLGTDYALVGLGVDPRDELSAESLRMLDRVGARYATLYAYGDRPQGFGRVARRTPDGLAEVEDLGGRMLAWFERAGAGDGAVAILRPDKFTFAVVPRDRLNQAVGELRAQLA